jgi:hypothetical protein
MLFRRPEYLICFVELWQNSIFQISDSKTFKERKTDNSRNISRAIHGKDSNHIVVLLQVFT